MDVERQRVGPFLRAAVILAGIVLVAPVIVVIPMSLTPKSSFSFPPTGLSLKWYANLFSSESWLNAIWLSFRVGVVAALAATILGTLAALALSKYPSRLSGAVRAGLMAPMIVPTVVQAVAFYIVFLKWKLVGSFAAYVMAHTVLGLPFVVVAVTASLAGYNAKLEVASASLGANAATTFRKITLPLIRPGVMSGFVLAFVTSFDEAVIALFIQSAGSKTLPVKMFDAINVEIDPTVAAASTLILLVSSAVVVAWQILAIRRTRKGLK